MKVRGKKILWLFMLTVFLVVMIPVNTMAANHTVSTWSEFQDAWNNDSDNTITIVLSGDIEMAQPMNAKADKLYVIDGGGHVLKNASLLGLGAVQINADILSSNGNALKTAEGVNVTVNGNISGYLNGVESTDSSIVTVNGNISGYTGISASRKSVVNAVGNISGNDLDFLIDPNLSGDGVSTKNMSTVNVKGDVFGGKAHRTTKGGSINGGAGVSSTDDSRVNVLGNVYGGNITVDESLLGDPASIWSSGGPGVLTYVNTAVVTVSGNVTGGNAQGLFALGGNGISALSSTKVIVGGNVTAGNVTSVPNADPKDNIGNGGIGVDTESTSTVQVGGNVTGGNANNIHTPGGPGVSLLLADDASIYAAPAGTLHINGMVNGGKNLTSGKGEVAIYYHTMNVDIDSIDSLVIGKENMEKLVQLSRKDQIVSLFSDYYRKMSTIETGLDPVKIDDNLFVNLSAAAKDYGMEFSLPLTRGSSDVEAAKDKFIQELATKFAGPSVSDKDFKAFIDQAVANYSSRLNLILDTLSAKLLKNMILPQSVTVWKLSDNGAGLMTTNFGPDYFKEVFSKTCYIIRVDTPENGTLSSDKGIALAGETITAGVKANNGYHLDTLSMSGIPLEAKNNVYSFSVPVGGGVNISANFAANINPPTGDNLSLVLWFGIISISAMAGIVLLHRRMRGYSGESKK